MMLAYGIECLVAVSGLSDDLEIRLEGKDLLQPVENDGMIVGDHQADGHGEYPPARGVSGRTRFEKSAAATAERVAG